MGFNPRTHTGCDVRVELSKLSTRVSIHAPTRGATRNARNIYTMVKFQSTHPHGVRPFVGCVNNSLSRVSIHAPTRGATSKSIFRSSFSTSFNPRTHTGCDLHWYEAEYVGYVFQSTHPHGVRPAPNCDVGTTPKFQSTHPHGVRRNALRFLAARQVSIHAPTRGATSYITILVQLLRVSIHAPTRGAT